MSPEDTGQDAKVDGGRGGTWSVLGIMRAMRDAKPGIGQISIGGQRTKSDISNPHPKKKKSVQKGHSFSAYGCFNLLRLNILRSWTCLSKSSSPHLCQFARAAMTQNQRLGGFRNSQEAGSLQGSL